MNQFIKCLGLLLAPFAFTNSHLVFATNAATLAPVVSFVLSDDANEDDETTPVVIVPRRLDFEGGAVFSESLGTLTSLSYDGGQAILGYDSLDRLTSATVTSSEDSLQTSEISFTYVSTISDRLDKIELSSFSTSGLELKSEINFAYNAVGQFNDQTNATFEALIFQNNQEVIFPITVEYEPIYQANTLVMINSRVTDNFGSPERRNTTSISYRDGTISELVFEDLIRGSTMISRRESPSPFEQQVTHEITNSDGEVISSRSNGSTYEEEECNDSNRLVEENLSILSLFFTPSTSTFFAPEICRD